tara:strand:- start:46401 stop:46751 length:351 start_codon:yes stop_codon:yes gene_type:complete
MITKKFIDFIKEGMKVPPITPKRIKDHDDNVKFLLNSLKIPFRKSGFTRERYDIYVFDYNNKEYLITGIDLLDETIEIWFTYNPGGKIQKLKTMEELKTAILKEVDISNWMKKLNK